MRQQRRAYLLAVSLVAGVILMPSPAAGEEPASLPKDKPIRMELPICADEADRDCLETLGIVRKGRFLPGRVIRSGEVDVFGPVDPVGSDSGPINGTAVDRHDIWEVPGLKTESGDATFDPFIALTTPGLEWRDGQADFNYEVASQLEFEIGTGRGVAEEVTPACNDDGTCWRPEQILAGQILRVVVRTSWFQPSWARSHLGNTVLRVDKLQDGGSRITVQGAALDSPGFFFGGGRDPRPERREQFDFVDRRWTVYMMDANDPNFPNKCARHGFPLISGNQWGSGTPLWDRRRQEMNLEIQAPHLDDQGRAFRGHYEAFIPGAYARCLWGQNPKALQSKLVVEVSTEDGEEQAATTSIGYRSGGVRIIARNFTFSSPTITVRKRG